MCCCDDNYHMNTFKRTTKEQRPNQKGSCKINSVCISRHHVEICVETAGTYIKWLWLTPPTLHIGGMHYYYGTRTSIHILRTTSARICTPLIVSCSLRSLVWHAICNKNSSLIWVLCNLYGPHVTYMDPI